VGAEAPLAHRPAAGTDALGGAAHRSHTRLTRPTKQDADHGEDLRRLRPIVSPHEPRDAASQVAYERRLREEERLDASCG
jgi:hypothetical protein